MLGRLFFLAAALGIVVTICCCRPGEEPRHVGDNTHCRLDGYQENSIRGRLRTSFDYEGGTCRCDCTGVPVDFICTISATVAN